jgi:hypothetical protein
MAYARAELRDRLSAWLAGQLMGWLHPTSGARPDDEPFLQPAALGRLRRGGRGGLAACQRDRGWRPTSPAAWCRLRRQDRPSSRRARPSHRACGRGITPCRHRRPPGVLDGQQAGGGIPPFGAVNGERVLRPVRRPLPGADGP